MWQEIKKGGAFGVKTLILCGEKEELKELCHRRYEKGEKRMEIGYEIEQIVAKMKRRADVVTKELKTCPDGRLGYEVRNGKGHLLQESYVNKRRYRHKLAKDSELAAALLKKEMLKQEKCSLEKDILRLQALEEALDPFDMNIALSRILKANPCIGSNLIKLALAGGGKYGWTAEFEQSSYRAEERKHLTTSGVMVRSKSEAIIAEKLTEHELPFRYEQVLHLGQTVLVPDFTIMRADGKLFYWEHEGLTSVRSYLDRQLQKSQIYAAAGIVPWDNFIVTYDDPSGSIDLRIVESEIVNKLLI